MKPKQKTPKKTSDINSDSVKRMLKWVATTVSSTEGVTYAQVKNFMDSKERTSSAAYNVKDVLKKLLDEGLLLKVGYKYVLPQSPNKKQIVKETTGKIQFVEMTPGNMKVDVVHMTPGKMQVVNMTPGNMKANVVHSHMIPGKRQVVNMVPGNVNVVHNHMTPGKMQVVNMTPGYMKSNVVHNHVTPGKMQVVNMAPGNVNVVHNHMTPGKMQVNMAPEKMQVIEMTPGKMQGVEVTPDEIKVDKMTT